MAWEALRFGAVLRPVLAAVLMLPLFSAPVSAATSAPVPLILDTDMGNDVDDAMALALVHALERRGLCRLLAVTVSKGHPKAAAFTDAVNTFYGRGDVPVGTIRDGATPEEGKFLGLVDAPDGFPHGNPNGGGFPDAVALLRRTLAAQPDQSVVLVQIGFFTNLARLLDTPADSESPLAGRELVRRKVKALYVMAGAFATVDGDDRYLEYNIVKDIASARALAARWPAPVVWSGYEVGEAAPYPHRSIEQDFSWTPRHPVRDAYYRYLPPPHDRPTWDLTAVLAAVLPDRGYFNLSPAGSVEIDDDGFTRFVPHVGGRDRFLSIDAAQAARLKETFAWLVSEPPGRQSPSP